MKIELCKANAFDARVILEMQVRALTPFYQKYKDTETSPAKDTVEKILICMEQPETIYYKI